MKAGSTERGTPNAVLTCTSLQMMGGSRSTQQEENTESNLQPEGTAPSAASLFRPTCLQKGAFKMETEPESTQQDQGSTTRGRLQPDLISHLMQTAATETKWECLQSNRCVGTASQERKDSCFVSEEDEARGEPHEQGRGRSGRFTADDNVFEVNRSASEICSLAGTRRIAHHPKCTIRQEESEK